MLRESWRPDFNADVRIKRVILLRRVVFLLLLAALTSAFGYLLFGPLFHPSTRFYVLTAGGYEKLELEPVPYFREDAIRFLTVQRKFEKSEVANALFLLDNPNTFRKSLERIRSASLHSSDVLLISLSAHPRVIDGRPYLLCGSANGKDSLQGSVAMEEVLEELGRITVDTTLVMLDLGFEPATSHTIGESEEFIYAVEELMRVSMSNSLWLMISNSPGENSYSSSELKASVFSYAVSQGLQGKSDFNQDNVIHLDELYRFIFSFTDATIQQASAGMSNQTPILLRTGSNLSASTSTKVIASVPSLKIGSWWSSITGMLPSWSSKTEDSEKDLQLAADKKEAEKRDVEKNWLSAFVERKAERVKDFTVDELNDNINYLPSFLSTRVKRTLGTSDELEEPNAPSTETNPTLAASEDKQETGKPNAGVPDAADDMVQANPVTMNDRGLPDLSRLGAPSQTNLELLLYVWQFCSYFDRPKDSLTRPVDLAPLEWRAYVDSVRGIEERQRKDAFVDSEDLRANLLSEIIGNLQFAMTGQAKVGTLIKQIPPQMLSLDVPSVSVSCIAFVESFSEYGGPPISAAFKKQIQAMDKAIRSSDRELFDKWLSQLPEDEANQFWEFFVSKLMSARQDIPWGITRRTLTLWRRLEIISCNPLNSNLQIQNELRSTNRLMLQSTRMACDQIESDWEQRCLIQLDVAERSLETVASQVLQVQTALQLRNQLLNELPSLLVWRKTLVERLGSKQIDSDMASVMRLLGTLSSLLLDREHCDLNELKSCHLQLNGALERIENLWNQHAKELIEGNQPNRISVGWLTDTLLSTSLVKGPSRNRLIALSSPATPSNSNELEIAAVLPKSPLSRTKSIADNFQIRLARSVAEIAQIGLGLSTIESESSDKNQTDLAIDLPQQIEKVYQDLPNRIRGLWNEDASLSKEEDVPIQLARLRVIDHCMRSVRTENIGDVDCKTWVSKLWRMEFLMCVRNKQFCTKHMLEDAIPEEIPFIVSSIERLSLTESALSGGFSSFDLRANRLQSKGTNTISLLVDANGSGEVVFKNVGKPINNAWLLLDYNHDVLEVENTTNTKVYSVATMPQQVSESVRQAEQQWLQSIATPNANDAVRSEAEEVALRAQLNSIRDNLLYPIHPTPTLMNPSLGLASGQEFRLPFRVRRIGRGPEMSKIIWKMVGDGEYLRHETWVQLPAPKRIRLKASELTAGKSDGASDGITESEEGLMLYPMSDRSTDFRFGVSNETAQARLLSIDFFSCIESRDVFLPDGFLNEEASSLIANRLGELERIASIPEFALNSSPTIQWLTIESVNGISTPAVLEESDKDDAKSPKTVAYRNGLVFVMTDKKTNEKYWRRIDCRVRHPRGYVEPRVSFDAITERIEVRFKSALSDTSLRTEIPIKARILEGLPRGTEMKLEGTIIGESELILYCAVPPSAPRELTLEIDVDRYPRAFVYHVPCWQTKTDIPLALDSQSISILEPSVGKCIGPEAKLLSATLKIDMTSGAFGSRGDIVEIGWDLDRDREFANETTIRFASDRLANIQLSATPTGGLAIKARVMDVKVELPPPAVKNNRVNLLARIISGNETVWSQPVEVISDSDPPVITGVELLPGTQLVQGTELLVRVGVDDANLSGVVQVDAMLDVDGLGAIDATGAKPMTCAREADGSWKVSLPTEDASPGRKTLFVRAKDKVGNQSLVAKAFVEIVDKKGWEEKQKQVVQELSGSVTYSEAPISNAKVWLEDEKGVVLHRTNADERGMFRLQNVQVGKYKLVAIGVVKNRPRKAERPIELAPAPAAPLRVRLIAK